MLTREGFLFQVPKVGDEVESNLYQTSLVHQYRPSHADLAGAVLPTEIQRFLTACLFRRVLRADAI